MTNNDRGVILVQVLVIIAIASAAVMLMLSYDDVAIERSQRLREAARAVALTRGGEQSAVVALRRDGVTAPDTDNASEAWAKIGEQQAGIEGGRFSLAVEDAQSRFNLNNLALDPDSSDAAFRRLTEQSRIAPPMADLIVAYVRGAGALTDISQLAAGGVDEETLGRLSEVVTVLPSVTKVNLNTAGGPVVAAMLGDPVLGALLVARRDRAGFVTSTDLTGIGAPTPAEAGFTSDFFTVSTEVTIGDTRQSLRTLLRRTLREGAVEVAPIRRWR